MRTRLSDHGRLAAGVVLGAITAALFAGGLFGGSSRPAESPLDRASLTRDGQHAPEPLPGTPAHASSSVRATPTTTVTSTTPTTTTTTTAATTTTTSKHTTTTTTTTTVTTTTRTTTTTTTTRRCGLLLC